MKPTIKLLILLFAACIAYGLQSFTCIKKNEGKADSSVFKTKEGENLYLAAYAKALTLWPVKHEEIDIKTGFGKAHVTISGPERGNPLVLLHGMNASSTMWYPNIEMLSKDHRVYAIDFIAEPGRSVQEKEFGLNEDIGNWYKEIFQKLRLKDFSIVGGSRGGWITTRLALDPEIKINKIVLISPAQTFIQVKPNGGVLKNLKFALSPEKSQLEQTLQTLSTDPDKLEKLWTEQYLIAVKHVKKEPDVLKMMTYTDKELASIKIPVLVMVGDNDIFNNENSIKRAKKHIPNVEAEIIKNSGHFVSFDQPKLVNERILNFLNKK
jgi:pimeloyl-ACP methyl ester carboxylesterase